MTSATTAILGEREGYDEVEEAEYESGIDGCVRDENMVSESFGRDDESFDLVCEGF